MKRCEKPEGMGSINDWGLYYNTDYAGNDNRRRENERATFSVRLCPDCNQAYETVFNAYSKEYRVDYYPHFYKRGLHKMPCYHCQ